MIDRFPDAPDRVRQLPVDHRGFPVPWFVAWQDGQPIFPAMDAEKMMKAQRDQLCWVCGGRLGRFKVYVIGPMCVANRISAEPPSHLDCALFAARHCPFLTQPQMKRVPVNKYGGCVENVAGIMLDRNPGVTAVVTCHGAVRSTRDPRGGLIFEVEPISEVRWFACGREATRAEVEASFDSGLPALREMAEQDGARALAQLAKAEAAARELFPA